MMAEGLSLDCQSQLRVTEQLLPPARRKECAWVGGRGKAVNAPALPHFWRVLCRRGLGRLYRGPLPWSVRILDPGCVHDFLVATGVLVRKTYKILKKRTMSEDFTLSQVLLTAFLQSCLILEHARDWEK